MGPVLKRRKLRRHVFPLLPNKDVPRLICQYLGKYDLVLFKKALFPNSTTIKLSEEFTEFAAKNGYFSILKWLHSQKCPWDCKTTVAAVKYGNVDMFKWLIDQGCPFDCEVKNRAASNGLLEMLIHIWNNNAQWYRSVADYASYGGHVHILQWMHENGCIFVSSNLYYAVFGGRLASVIWFVNKAGHKWKEYLCGIANKCRYFYILQWVHKNGHCSCEYHTLI